MSKIIGLVIEEPIKKGGRRAPKAEPPKEKEAASDKPDNAETKAGDGR
ncbi:MAG: hypothetical protein PHI98_14930 [Eubacteriales bacterium]|nr:hypothetical protein [Eubacteriales bacterium]